MPRLRDRTPNYRKHKSSGQAIVTLNGRDHYLGPHGSAVSRREYDRLISEWMANGRLLPATQSDRTVVELMASYVRFAKEYYRASSEFEATKYSLRPLKELYGRLPIAEFSPLKLKAVRQKMIEADLCRNEINKRIGRIKRMFRWGVETNWFLRTCCTACKRCAGYLGVVPKPAKPSRSGQFPKRSWTRSGRRYPPRSGR